MEPQKLSITAGVSGVQVNLERDEAKEGNRKGIRVFLKNLNLILQVTGNFWRVLSRMLACKDLEVRIMTLLFCEEWIGESNKRGREAN